MEQEKEGRRKGGKGKRSKRDQRNQRGREQESKRAKERGEKKEPEETVLDFTHKPRKVRIERRNACGSHTAFNSSHSSGCATQ
jgi:hypothetical protein